MILPDKYVMLSESFIGLSALVLEIVNADAVPIDILWNAFERKYIKSNKLSLKPTYQKFIYVIEFMYLTNMISYTDEGEIVNENIRTKNPVS